MSRIMPLLAVGLLIALSGCATISVTTEVADANTIERFEFNMTTSTTVYGFLNEGAKDDGYDSLRDQVMRDSDVSPNKIEYSEDISGNDAHISISMRDIAVENASTITLEETDGELVFEDDFFYNESAEPDFEQQEEFMSGLVVEYTLIMPGDITDSNAAEVDGNVATWRDTGATAMSDTKVRASSEPPAETGVPGFGVGATLLALVASLVMLTRRR